MIRKLKQAKERRRVARIPQVVTRDVAGRIRKAGLATSLVALFIALAIPAFATGPSEEPWINDMNQEEYWENLFNAECTKYENHSGYIPFDYDVVIVKSGSHHVTIWFDVLAGSIVNNGINPNNGKLYGSPFSWVTKCNLVEETTTTTIEETTTTVPEETTTVPEETTTVPEETTTVPEVTTTSEITTFTTVIERVTTVPEVTTTVPEELPYTGAGEVILLIVSGAALLAGGYWLVKQGRYA